jgi:hypothetical protein
LVNLCIVSASNLLEGSSSHHNNHIETFQMIKDQNKALQEENQLLKFKLDVLLDMVCFMFWLFINPLIISSLP